MSDGVRIPAELDAAFLELYAGRPAKLAEVRANALAYERLKAMAYESSSYAVIKGRSVREDSA